MSPSRRKWIARGATALAGASGVAVAARLADKYGLIPPDGVGVWGPGETLTYAAQRLLGANALAREFTRDQITKPPRANGRPPQDEEFKRLEASGFTDWRLAISGMVDRPATFSIAELKSFPQRGQITHLACEEGWSYIAEWAGVPLSHVLNLVGMQPRARFVVYYSFQTRWWDSLDMADALHPQTILALGMNGAEIPVAHGGPLRLRVPRHLGYKSLKYVTRMVVTDTVKNLGKGLGGATPERGYAWYAGI
ncbi:MAG: oxidoreductase [Acidobacteria bacterium]|nr:oxidoreductase [Acidobacteriota bacterium]